MELSKEVKSEIRKYLLKNAVKYGGKANPKAVLGQILGKHAELRKEAGKVLEVVKSIADEINELSADKQRKFLEESAPELLAGKEKKKKDINESFEKVFGIEKGQKVRTAFPPEPSKYPHIGHAKAILLNYELARHYDGEFFLRFEDTNPALAKKEFYDIHLDNYAWLGVKPDRVTYASDFIEDMYEKIEELMRKGHAYVCTCSQEVIRSNRMNGRECSCRTRSARENLALWRDMHDSSKVKQGKAVVRARIDMRHKNSAMRDPALMRIIDEEHVRTGRKYRVWPAYDFENSFMDGKQGITHRLRSKEFELRNELQRHLQRVMGFAPTRIGEFARFNLEGVESSGRVIREKIEKGELSGWDDPSLTTLVALRRRGFLPEAVRSFVLSTGITKTESTLTWDDLIVHNRRILDKLADRFFFVADPVKIRIQGSPRMNVKLKRHPDMPERGFRKFETGEEFFISSDDLASLEDGKLYRLMDCLNFEKRGGEFFFVSESVSDYRERGEKIMHWLPASDGLAKTSVRMTDNRIVEGLSEKGAASLEEGSVIQFERFGFCRLDRKGRGLLEFWYTHR